MSPKILKSVIEYRPPHTENLVEFIRDGLRSNPNGVLVVDGSSGCQWTGIQIEHAITRISQFLIQQCGIGKGDVISIFENDADLTAILILSIISVGATSKLITTTVKDLVSTAKVSNSKCIISTKENLDQIRSEFGDQHSNYRFVSLDESEDGFCLSIKELLDNTSKQIGISLDELIQNTNIDVNKNTAVIQFSSGTTGNPKKIPRTHSNLCHLVASVNHPELMEFKAGVIIGGQLSMAYRTGLWCLLACIHTGATFVIKSSFQDPDDVFSTIEKFRLTHFSSAVILLCQLAGVVSEMANKYDLSSLKEMMTAGTKIVDSSVPDLMVNTLGLEALRQCFGMTESGWVFLIEKSLAQNQYLTVGHVVPSMEAAIMDPETGQLLGPNEKGEVVLRGPQIFPGYLTDSDGLYNRSDFTEDGWFKIGDQAYYTADGLFYIAGRYKELMYLQNRKRMYPDQIEAVLLKHPAVEAACVVKVKGSNDDYYDSARAYLILNKGFTVETSEIMKFINQEAPLIILEGGIRILTQFPRLPNGKINKQALKVME